MKRNYLLVCHIGFVDNIKYRYFETKEEMDNFINTSLEQAKTYKGLFEVLYKYEIKEVK